MTGAIAAGLGFLLAGFPFIVPLFMMTMIGLWLLYPEIDPVVISQQMIGGVKPAALVAVPLFVFAADIMTRGHTAGRLVALVESFIGHFRGGLPMTAASACALFGAVSGSTQATVVAIGGPLRPRLLAAGYRDSFVTALIINSSDIALLIPPSIGMIVYGVVSGTSVGELFIAGIGPGLLILACFCAYIYFRAVKYDRAPLPKAGWRERAVAARRAALPLGLPLIIAGGIYGGIFSPTEAAAVSVAYALFLEMFVYREIGLKEVHESAISTGLVTAVVFILVGAGAAFSWLISFAEIPATLLSGLELSATSPPVVILAWMALAYFIGCMFVDPIVVILILTPIFHPLVVSAGIDPVHAGVVVTLQAAIGSATPPFGCDIFTAMAIFRKPYLEVVRGTPPFIFILFLVSIMIILIPGLSLFLRDLAF